jgi:pimeloyl-ACP methyl ester carboxylesterase
LSTPTDTTTEPMSANASSTVNVDGVALHVQIEGRGHPVLCLHAVGHDLHDFDPLSERLGHRFRFIRFDWPGQGRSGWDHQPAGAERYATLTEGLVKELRLDNPVILGNSIGGAVAIRFASRNPVAGLVLCDSSGLVAVDATVRRVCRLFEAFFAAGERGAWWYRPLFALYYSFVLPSPAARGQRRRIIRANRTTAAPLRQAWASFGQQPADIREIAATLDVPIWVAWSRKDYVIPLRYCLPAIRMLKSCSLSLFDGGHSPFLEQPDAFAKGFTDFMADIPSIVSTKSTL